VGNVLPVKAVLRSTVRIKNRFPVRWLTPPQATENALAIAIQSRGVEDEIIIKFGPLANPFQE
jgi:hypothetical protein